VLLVLLGVLVLATHKNVGKVIRRQNETKTILIWNGSSRKEVRNFGWGKDAFAKKKCSYTQCEMVDKRSKFPLEHYDAIMLVLNDEYTSAEQMMIPDFKNDRDASQHLVLFTQESPPALKRYYNMTRLAQFFNLTMTYRMDSDIRLLYGRIIPKENAPRTPEEISYLRKIARPRLPSDTVSNKTKSVAWMVSHCKTHGQRETYAKELSKYINVDIYGRCGNLTCAKHSLHHSDPKCYDMIELTYKFYLSFENAICPDYVTEKFFKIMGHHIVPVVYGGADYSQHAPPHSYIDARKFKPKELAAYLKLLDANDTLYNEYFWWKDYYSVEYSVEDMSRHGFCDLCRKLHQLDGNFRSYKELESEWGDGNKCQQLDSSWL
jgi:alpha-1,3-fucosyltransferase